MSRTVHEILGGRTDDFEVLDQLHSVPPHSVYEVEFEGERAVCKISETPRASAGIEGRVMRYVGEKTSVPVPEVLAVDQDFFVASYCEDAPEDVGDQHLDEEWLRIAGRGLAKLHEESTFDRPGLLVIDDVAEYGIRVDSDSNATWSDALDDLLGLYHESVRGTGYSDVVSEARDFLSQHAEKFDVLDNRDPVLIHGWFTPEHVAVKDGEVKCVIDFEHSLVGCGEWDYWRTAVPLFEGGGWEKPEDAEKIFRSGYESIRSLPPNFEERGDAYRTFVTTSYLDSLHTQRGIGDETRDKAEFLKGSVYDTLRELRERWE